MDLMESLMISAAGMRAQGQRLRVVAENLANADSVSEVPGGDPYRRQTISFKNQLDRELGMETVQVSKVGEDPSDFRMKYDPGNPAADRQGLREAAERQQPDRNERHARSAALVRSEPAGHRSGALDASTHHRSDPLGDA